MCAAFLALGPQVHRCRHELSVPGKSYTANTVDYLRRLCYRNGYEEFRTPTVLDKSLWVRSGHWANYADKMYITTKDEREFGVERDLREAGNEGERAAADEQRGRGRPVQLERQPV